MMKHLAIVLVLLSVFALSTASFADFVVLDGDSTDWASDPILVNAYDNTNDLFPSDVGAAITDNVDVKHVRAKIVDNVLYGFIRFQDGPAWPNNSNTGDIDGEQWYESRGHYHLMLDLDNDATTGWISSHYETHFTPVGYLESQGVEGQELLGAEILAGVNLRTYRSAPHSDSAGIKNSGIKEIAYAIEDYSEYDSETDAGSYLLLESAVSELDSSKALAWDGFLGIDDTELDLFMDNQSKYFYGHSFGYDFLEFAFDITPMKDNFTDKGKDYFKEGDVIGVTAMVETPADDWGTDIPTRGEFAVSAPTGINANASVIEGYKLSENYPNPFNPTTSISYTIPQTADVTIEVFNTLGQRISTLVDSKMSAGEHTVNWNGMNDAGQTVASGIYFYRMVSDQVTFTKNMLLLK